MNINWIISEDINNNIDPKSIKDIAPSWGNYKTHKKYKTDNCICNTTSEIMPLIKQGYSFISNLWIPVINEEEFKEYNLRYYAGAFKKETFPNKEDFICFNLTKNSDIILLLGFDFRPVSDMKLKGKKRTNRLNYYLNVSDFIKDNPKKQYVLVDYNKELSPMFLDIPNLVQDSYKSVKELL